MSFKRNVVALIILCCSALSVVGACYIIYIYIKNKIKSCGHTMQLQQTASRIRFANNLILWLAITDLIDYLSEFAGASIFLFGTWSHDICLVQAIGTHFGSVSSIAWTVAISWTIHQIIKSPQTDLWKMAIIIHCAVWFVCILCVLPPLITDSYGEAEGHCWIKNKGVGIYWRWICFYVPLWISIIYMVYVYFMLIQFRHRVDDAPNTTLLLRNMRYFPAILIVCYIPATIKRIWDHITSHKTPSVELKLQCAMYGCMMIIGFLDGILYGWLLSATPNDPSQSSNDSSPPQVIESLLQIGNIIQDDDDDDDDDDDNKKESQQSSSNSGNQPQYEHKTAEENEEVIFKNDIAITATAEDQDYTKYSKQKPVIQKNIGMTINVDEKKKYMKVLTEDKIDENEEFDTY